MIAGKVVISKHGRGIRSLFSASQPPQPQSFAFQSRDRTVLSLSLLQIGKERKRRTQRIATKMQNQVISAFLSVTPLEPVLVFASQSDAQAFRGHCSVARIFPNHPKWVYMPMPSGLLRVRTAQRGDVAFEFESRDAARAWNEAILQIGTINPAVPHRLDFDHTVYLGRILRP